MVSQETQVVVAVVRIPQLPQELITLEMVALG
jgi:hypothetical protein